jgi:putative flippase GtrA
VSVSDASPSDRRTLGIAHDHIRQFALYCVNGVFTLIAYTVVFWSLLALSHRAFVLDVAIAYAVAGVCNYTGARRLFKPTTTLRMHVARYVTVVAGAFAVTSGLAWLLDHAGAPDAVGAYLPAVVTAVPVFVVMRTWVFSSPVSAN